MFVVVLPKMLQSYISEPDIIYLVRIEFLQRSCIIQLLARFGFEYPRTGPMGKNLPELDPELS